MAIRAELEAREQNCHTAGDWIDLARDALAAPQDVGYATELLQRAELKCQSVHEYLDLAGFVAHEGQDPAYAEDLYNHAESVAQTPEEKIQLCQVLMERTGDAQRCVEILDAALRRTTEDRQFIEIADCADKVLTSASLVRRSLEQLTQPLRDMQGFEQLARELLDLGHEKLARKVFVTASRLCREMKELIDYAETHWQLFNDSAGALAILGDAEADCQSTREFVDLVGAYRRLFQDNERVSELMELAVEYAISADDQLDLAEGYWRHLHDPASAARVYRGVLDQLDDSEQLISLASHISSDIGDRALCRDYLDRASSLAPDLKTMLTTARASKRLMTDPEHTQSLLEAAAVRFNADHELAELIDTALELDLDELAARYLEQRLFKADFAAALDSMETIHRRNLPQPLLRQALDTARKGAQTPAEFIHLANQANEKLKDPEFNRAVLEAAEELSSAPDELEAVALAVGDSFPFDNPWHERLRKSIAQRQLNADVYEDFRDREAATTSVSGFLELAREASEALQDRNLVRKLLLRAENSLTATQPRTEDIFAIMEHIASHLGDIDWLERLCDLAERQINNFGELVTLIEHQQRLLPPDIALSRGEIQLNRWQAVLEERPEATADDYLALARQIHQLSADDAWAHRAIDKAAAFSKTPHERMMVSLTLTALGDDKSASHFRTQALEGCESQLQLRDLITLCREHRCASDSLQSIYVEGGKRFTRPRERLIWMEQIPDLFEDPTWLDRELVALREAAGNGLEEAAYRAALRLGIERRP